jgi:hypothetical protein
LWETLREKQNREGQAAAEFLKTSRMSQPPEFFVTARGSGTREWQSFSVE